MIDFMTLHAIGLCLALAFGIGAGLALWIGGF